MIRRFVITTILILSVCFCYATNYYLSNSGNDNNSGTSPSEAWETINHLNTITLHPGDSILFESGGVFRGEIDLKNSGTADSLIYFGKYGTGDLPIISGALEVNGWTLYQNNIYQAPFAAEASQLFANDKLMTSARYPNQGYLFQKGPASIDSFVDSSLNQETNYWKGATVRMRMNDRAWENRRVDSSNSSEVFLESPFVFPILSGYGYYMDNLFSLLDTAEEWYDSLSMKIFFYAPLGADPSTLDVEASVYYYGLKILNAATFISVENLQFEKQAISGISSDSSCTTIFISDCILKQQGQIGIDFFSGGSEIHISDNSFYDCQSMGIRERFINQGSLSNNYFKNIGTMPGYGSANDLNGFPIVIDESAFVTISQNTIDSCGNGGISVAANNCYINENVIFNSFLIANNWGVIANASSFNQNNIISDNIILSPNGNNDATPGNVPYTTGIILDNVCEGCEILHNTIKETSGGGILLEPGSVHYLISNNVVYGCNESQLKFIDGDSANTTTANDIKRNVLYALSEDQDIVQLTSRFINFMPAVFDSNYYFNPYDYYAFHRIVEQDSAIYDFRYTLKQWIAETEQDINSISTFFYRNRFTSVDSIGPEQIVNGPFTNNLDNWTIDAPGNSSILLDNSTPLDFGCMKINKDDSIPYFEGGAISKQFQIDSGAFYKVNLSNYSLRDGNVHLYVYGADSIYSNIGLNCYFPFYNYRQDYETVFQASGSSEHGQAQILINYKDSLVWVDNISISQVTAQYSDPHRLSRLFLNPSEFPIDFDLADSIFFDLDQNEITGLFTLPPYSSSVLIYDSSMILGVSEAPLVNSQIQVFPNPSKAGTVVKFQLSDHNVKDVRLILVDMMGRICNEEILERFNSVFSYKLPDEISSGMYLLNVLSDIKEWQAKLLVE